MISLRKDFWLKKYQAQGHHLRLGKRTAEQMLSLFLRRPFGGEPDLFFFLSRVEKGMSGSVIRVQRDVFVSQI